jgi:hypothetical protein
MNSSAAYPERLHRQHEKAAFGRLFAFSEATLSFGSARFFVGYAQGVPINLAYP